MLGQKLARHEAQVWLVNTGWSGGPYGVGSRMKIAYTRALIYSVGCQSGLNVPDEEALNDETALTIDFAQAFQQRGALYIGNTGFGYGDSQAIGYSENLALKLTQQLSNGPVGVGQALLQAKQRYLADAGYASFGDYDAKVLAEATLYGLPMRRVQLPTLSQPARPTSTDYLIGRPRTIGLYASLPITLSPNFTPVTITTALQQIIGHYYHIADEVQINPGRPIQPRTSLDLLPLLPAGETANGVLFLGGHYVDRTDFDPVVSRIVTDTANSEPPFGVGRWYPSPLHTLNRFDFGPQHRPEKLVVMPAQYLAATNVTGTERLFTQLRYTVLYTATLADFLPPLIEQVSAITTAQTIRFTVNVTDESDVDRVVVAYDTGLGEWRSFDLARVDAEEWSGSGPASVRQAYVQAVDGAGNVALSDNKGIYFSAVGLSFGPNRQTQAAPGAGVQLTHTLVNLGAGRENFSLTGTASTHWPVQIQPDVVALSPGLSATIGVTIFVPAEASPGVQASIVVTATALSNQQVTGMVLDRVTLPHLVYLPVLLKH